ncbi:hypothetical protein AB0D14_17905 [Streptomyces sp. NPDC048484]|uniref:hypothetical protein n=1 Tax=Streptomyces sp. NPDC048484 TaxID=3155146 RepID=UPI00342457A3
MSLRRSEAWLLRDAEAEVGETKVVDVQSGETRVVDVQLGESRIADSRADRLHRPDDQPDDRRNDRQDQPGEAHTAQIAARGAAQAPPGSWTTAADARRRWDAVTVTEEASASGRHTSGLRTSAPVSEAAASDHGSPDHGSSDHTPSAHVPEAPAERTPSVRRGAADPVKALMHRHRELCERAVDPLEIAAGLEAHGVTDRTATRFRHRDVFSLAEEMYARVPRVGDVTSPSGTPGTPKARADWAVLALLPGALCAAVVTGLRYTEGRPRLAVAVVGVLAVALGLRATLSRGPLHATRAWSPTPSARVWTSWLVAYALLGDGLLTTGIVGGPEGLPTGGPDSPWPIALAPVLALTAACAPASWCAHLFAVRARRRLATSRVLEEFAASVRPLLLGVFGLFLCALGGLLALTGAVLDQPTAYAGAGALGALLLLARLLTVHGFTHAPAVALGAAGTGEAAALLSVFGGRLPGCEALTVPVETVADAWGAGAIPALVCGAAALVLLFHATRNLTRASAHAARGDAQ